MGNSIPDSGEQSELQGNMKLINNRNQFIRQVQEAQVKTKKNQKGQFLYNYDPSSPIKINSKMNIRKSSTGVSYNTKEFYNYDSIQKGKPAILSTEALNFYVYMDSDGYKSHIVIPEPYEMTWGWLLSEVTRLYDIYISKRKESLSSIDTDYWSKRSQSSSKKSKVHK